jgi:hypothetical protein
MYGIGPPHIVLCQHQVNSCMFLAGVWVHYCSSVFDVLENLSGKFQTMFLEDGQFRDCLKVMMMLL